MTEAQEREFLVPPTPRNVREAPLSLESIQEVLARIPDRRRYALVRTLLATGIRRAELAALKVKHVDWDARKVWVPEMAEDGRAAAKGGNSGWVYISAVAFEAAQILGKRVTPHELRHNFASYAAAGDATRPPMPIKALQAQLRHKRDTTTLRYLHAVGSHAEAYQRSAPAF